MKFIWKSKCIRIAKKCLKKKNEIRPTSNHNLIVKSTGSGVKELVTILACNLNKCNFSKAISSSVKIKILRIRISNSVLI